MSYDIYTGLLKAFALPEHAENAVDFSYEYEHPKFAELKSGYPIEEIAGGGGDFSKAVNLMRWVSQNIYHKGDFSGEVKYNSLELLEYSFGKDYSNGINCVGLATILAECLLSVGVKARKVFIMPCSPYDGDNHVVAHVFIRETGKWVMFDPTLNAYISNEAGEPLGLLELRDCLANQQPIFFSNEAKYNDEEWTEDSAEANAEYFAKNLFWFQTSEVSAYNHSDGEKKNRFISLCPNGYDPKRVCLSNIMYRIRKYGDSENMRNWLENAEKGVYHFCGWVDLVK